MKREYVIDLPYEAVQEGKRRAREILWEKINEELFKEFGTDVYGWYEIEMNYSKTSQNHLDRNTAFYVIIEITSIKSLWQELKEAEERLKVGL